jgi:hypothetical protein
MNYWGFAAYERQLSMRLYFERSYAGAQKDTIADEPGGPKPINAMGVRYPDRGI